MAFYYVKTGGTATGDAGRYATKQTGSFATLGAAGYYDNLMAALTATTAPIGGDFILMSHLHDYVAPASHIDLSLTNSEPVGVFSVNDSNIAQYQAGAKETTASNSDLRTIGSTAMTFEGVGFVIGDQLDMNTGNSVLAFNNCPITFNSTVDLFRVDTDGCVLELNNCSVLWDFTGTVDKALIIRGGSDVYLNNVDFSVTNGSIDALISETTANGGATLKARGCDFSPITGYILEIGGVFQNDDTFIVELMGCKLSPSLTGYSQFDFVTGGQTLLITNSAATSAAAEHQYYFKTWAGDVQDDTQIYRDESTPFPSGTKASLKATTLSNAGIGKPLVFDAPSRYADLSNVASDTIRIYFASTTVLTDAEVWAEVSYPDGVNKHVYNTVSNRATDILSEGTTHTSDVVSTWMDGALSLTGYNEYYMDIDTSVDSGTGCVPKIKIHITKPSTTIYFDTSVGLV